MGDTKHRAPRAAQPSRRLAAIMFTDLVGYSAMAHRDEGLAIELLELHRGWVRQVLPQFGGVEIETVGDAFLIEFAGALSAVECAVAIQRRFAEHNAAAPPDRRMELRVGIHLGDVEHKADKVFGDGVNIASRIHGMARPGGICVSEDVHHAVRNRPAFQFTSLGTPPLKNITAALELFELAPSLNLAPPAEAAAARVSVVAGVPRRGWLPFVAAAGGGAAVVGLAAAIGWFATRPAAGVTPAIAVLPFENLSADPDSAFFTDGLHDTVIGHLSRVRGIKVISRTSVMGYRGQKASLRQIAGELGVGNIVEGSVQRAGNRLRVAAQLIDTGSDTHLWSGEYDRELKDVFEVQADIAQQVAAAVHAKLTPQEQASIRAVPTQNAAAYDLYLRAVVVQRMAQVSPERAREAIGWLGEAIAQDPGFASAHALLAEMHDYLHWFGFDSTEERRRLAAASADEALRLDPQLAQAHVAKATTLYHGSRSYDAAIRELEIAHGLAPGDAAVLFWMSMIYRRQGRWVEAVKSLEQAVALDPLNAQYLFEFGNTLTMLRRYADADPVYARLAHALPDDPPAQLWVPYNRFVRTGDLAGFSAAVARLPPDAGAGCNVALWRVLVASYERRFDDAVAAAAACPEPYVTSTGAEQVPREYFVARAQWFASGRKQSALAPKVRAQLEQLLAARPDQPGTRIGLAFTLAMLGDRERALAETERALADMPLARDALMGATILLAAAEVHANAGAEEQALDEIARALSLPSGGNAHEVKLEPAFEPLRKHPRFGQILETSLPKT